MHLHRGHRLRQIQHLGGRRAAILGPRGHVAFDWGAVVQSLCPHRERVRDLFFQSLDGEFWLRDFLLHLLAEP